MELRRIPLKSFPSHLQELKDDVRKPFPLSIPKRMRPVPPLWAIFMPHPVLFTEK